MSSEMETLGAASVGSLSTTRRADLSGQPCRNCGEMVENRHCPRCGQLAASFHRPFLSLIFESISDSFALDGRVARTMPLLMFRPGTLTRRYNEGKRARYVPPFRMFLLSSLIFYFIVFALLDRQEWANQPINLDAEATSELTEEEITQLRDELRAAGANTGVPWINVYEDTEGDNAPESPEGEAGESGGETAEGDGEVSDFEAKVRRIAENPRLFFMAVQDWAPRLSLLLVPLTMLALALMYFWKRKLYTYNHAIHAFHLHTWMYLAATIAVVASMLVGSFAWFIFTIALPIYVILSLRGAYGTGYFLGFVRMCLLMTIWSIGLSLLTAFTVFASVMSV